MRPVVKLYRQPLDRLAQGLILILALAMVVLLVLGRPADARIQKFTWDNRAIGVDDRAFLLTFSRPMDQATVEKNLVIEPPLPGRFSWSGRRMAYTLNFPAPYGTDFVLTLPQAADRFSQDEARFQSFESRCRSRQRAFAYVGLEGDERGRLMLYSFSDRQLVALTPPDWEVLDFKPYRQGDRILFSAISKTSDSQRLTEIYSVTTGLAESLDTEEEPGEITQLLDTQDYQNLKFDLSPDGRIIVVQRIHHSNPEDFGPWILVDEAEPRRLDTEPGGDFLIAPDSRSLLLQQGEGTAVIALDDGESSQLGDTLDFLPEYGLVMDVADSGTAAAMVSFNQDDPEKRYTQSLFWVSNEGEEKPLLTVTGAVIDAQFDPTGDLLYCLTSELIASDTYQLQPSVWVIDLRTDAKTELVKLPPQPSARMSLSPDGLAMLFNESIIDGLASQETGLTGESDPEAALAATIGVMPLYETAAARLNRTPQPAQVQLLPFSGLYPVWIP